MSDPTEAEWAGLLARVMARHNAEHGEGAAERMVERGLAMMDRECPRCGSFGGFGCYECTPSTKGGAHGGSSD